MRVLVLGGTRFIGPIVVKRLNATGHEVTIFHRGLTAADLPPRSGISTGNGSAWPTFAMSWGVSPRTWCSICAPSRNRMRRWLSGYSRASPPAR